ARVTMLGDGPLRPRLLEALADSGLTNVEAPGFVSEADKWLLLRSASLFVAPSREEGWGIAVGEALLAGLPVVCYDLPAYRHLRELPIRVPMSDREAFVATVMSLLADPGRLTDVRERVETAGETLPRWRDILAREIETMCSRVEARA